MQEALDYFFAEGMISEVLYTVKSGKEATVYCCQARPSMGADLLAAKVYRSAHQRGFKNDALYWEGGTRAISRRVRVAMAKRSAFGREATFAGWISRERETLEALTAAGASVPRPITQEGSALLMAWIGDEEEAAPAARVASSCCQKIRLLNSSSRR